VKDVKQEWLERPEAGTVVGYRLISSFARLCGRSAARLVLYPIALYFLIRRGPERRASRAYLERVNGRPASIWQVARHIHTFAAVILDRAFLLAERYKRFDIRVHGLDDLRAAWGRQQGVLVFGSHLGSFEALRVLAQVRPDVKVRVVIDVEQNPALSRVLNALNPELARSIINARREGMTTALAIKEALDEKALVTLLVDRARPGNGSRSAISSDIRRHSRWDPGSSRPRSRCRWYCASACTAAATATICTSSRSPTRWRWNAPDAKSI
jgi:predicted LPLAT superfamily acyltransferase